MRVAVHSSPALAGVPRWFHFLLGGALALLLCVLLDGARPCVAAHEPGPTAAPSAPAARPHVRHNPELAKGKFLVASRTLTDPNFSETIVLLLAYGAEGAMGIIVNRRSDLRLSKVLPQIEELKARPDRLYWGGPVSPNNVLLLIRTRTPPADALAVLADLAVSSSLTVLKHELTRKGRGRFRAYAGYAGWGPGQLEAEIGHGDWHVTSAHVDAVFDKAPETLWHKLIPHVEGKWVRAPRGPALTALSLRR